MSVRLVLLSDVLAIGAESYKDNSRILAALDDKAQKMGAIAGLFLAVPFAVLRPDSVRPLHDMVGVPGLLMLAVAVILFMICIGLCLIVMWARSVRPPLDFNSVKGFTDDLLHSPAGNLTEDVQERYCNDKISVWEECLSEQEKIIQRKWRFLLASQIVLSTALLPIGLLLLFVIYSTIVAVPPLR
jgi:hypothetical protein